MLVDVAVWLTIFVILYFMNPLMKLVRLMHQVMIMFSKSKPDDLKKFGEWAVVTGATDDIGKEFSKEFAKRDLNLVLIGESIEKLNKLKEEVQNINLNIQIKIIEVDFNRGKYEYQKIRNQMREIPVGILVNNVGVGFDYPMYLEEISESQLWELINVNIGATTLMTHLVIEDMKKRGKGAIVNICSALDKYPSPLLAVYGASKTFVRYFTEALRDECGKNGLKIQTLSPLYVDTKLVSYSSMMQDHAAIFPSAATYVRNAIVTLGKLDSSSGYWRQEVIKFFMSLIPMVWRRKLLFSRVLAERTAYLQSTSEQKIQIDYN